MSYDVTLKVDTGGPEPAYLHDALDANYTYNIQPMLAEAIGADGIYGLAGKPGSQVAEALRAGIAAMEGDPAKYVAMNPSNGWGDYEGCLLWLRTIALACMDHPAALLVVS